MYIFLWILGILFGFVAFCIVVLVLLQESKGGGIAAVGIAGVDNIIGARNPLRKLTVVFSILFLLLILGIGVSINKAQKTVIPEIPVEFGTDRMPVDEGPLPEEVEASPMSSPAGTPRAPLPTLAPSTAEIALPGEVPGTMTGVEFLLPLARLGAPASTAEASRPSPSSTDQGASPLGLPQASGEGPVSETTPGGEAK
ncbi:MAG: preprotein translocase subunit SecG [Planctomycetota bacterium]